ncbi:hypothetical protein DFH09DRAFT_1428204 [Mycena vulgaris]|nr:hypothetical protein DFH09DRAFT_1428204 [Mycena vulgaris]
MGVTGSATPSRFKLRRLLIHTGSSECVRHTNFSTPDSKCHLAASWRNILSSHFVNLIVVLPSLHEAGQVQLHHAVQTKRLDHDTQGGHLPSIVVGLSGVEQQMSVVTGGYRVALIHNILPTAYC